MGEGNGECKAFWGVVNNFQGNWMSSNNRQCPGPMFLWPLSGVAIISRKVKGRTSQSLSYANKASQKISQSFLQNNRWKICLGVVMSLFLSLLFNHSWLFNEIPRERFSDSCISFERSFLQSNKGTSRKRAPPLCLGQRREKQEKVRMFLKGSFHELAISFNSKKCLACQSTILWHIILWAPTLSTPISTKF